MKIKHPYILLLSLSLLIFVCCNNKVEEKPNKDKFHQPLFMTLSPYISDNQFYEKTKKLNKEHKLEKGKFVLRLNNENYYFNITKDKHSISLLHSQKEECFYSSLSYELSDFLNNKYKKTLNKIKSVYDKKYILNDKQIPLDGLYYFENMKYTLYKDKDKYILFGYKLVGSRIGNEIERQKRLDEMIRKMGIKDKSENTMYKHLSSNDPKITFGIKIKIDYFEKGYIDSLLVRIDKDTKNSKLKEEKVKLEKEKENQMRKENINNI